MVIKDAKDARCPFFMAHGNCFVVCEGVIPDTTSTARFARTTDKDLHYKTFCCGRWRYCEHARALENGKYGDGEE